jgi:glycosyltransferase involved in cell wall biosynthesis
VYNEMMGPELSVVIPVYNESVHIADSLATIESYVREVTKNYEMIVIDDGSADDTWFKLTEAAKIIPNLYIIKLSRNFGKEYALCAGLENATGRAVIIMDADMQHPPSLIPQMVRTWREEKVGIVECVKRERGQESTRNRVGARLFYGLMKTLTGYNLRGASDFKLIDQQVVQAWTQMPEKSTFFRGMTAWLGFKRVQLEFDVSPRAGGDTKWCFVRLTRLALNVVVSFTSLPLRFVSIAGMVLFLASIIIGIQTLYHKFIGTAVTGFTTVILLQLIIGSVMMISIGIIGEYIAAIYNEVKGRPRYVIEETATSRSKLQPKSDKEVKELVQV